MATATLSSSCIATRKFTRNEVKTSSDALSTRIDANEGSIKEAHDGLAAADRKITGVDDRLTRVSTETGQRLDGLKGDVSAVDQKVATVDQNAKAASERLGGSVNSLDQKFQNRNNYSVANEKAITFRFDSATLDAAQHPILDEIAQVLMQNVDALVVLEGRTDSSGDKEYNVRLGERRVEAVRRYLAVEKGVPVYKIHQISFGDAQPVAPNDSREGREKNRTVSIELLVPRAQTAATSSSCRTVTGTCRPSAWNKRVIPIFFAITPVRMILLLIQRPPGQPGGLASPKNIRAPLGLFPPEQDAGDAVRSDKVLRGIPSMAPEGAAPADHMVFRSPRAHLRTPPVWSTPHWFLI
jgi:outer membrane protein OmpA-like peptidoglycan-associated protein